MTRYNLAGGASCPSDSGSGGVNADFMFLLRCGEGASSSNLSDGAPEAGRPMTVAGSPGVVGALIGSTESVGARSFNGSSQYAYRAAADGDETTFRWSTYCGWGAHLWVAPSALGADAVVLELGEYGVSSSYNVQFQLALLSTGALRYRHEYDAGSTATVTSDAGLIAAGSTYAIGVSVRASRKYHERLEVRLYIDGRCVTVSDNVPPPTGGADARWIVAASRAQGSGIGTPGSYFNGTIDDVAMCMWAPEHEFFRDLFGSSKRDYIESTPDVFGLSSLYEYEVHTRLLVEVGVPDANDPDTFPDLPRVNATDVDLARACGFDPLVSVKVRRSTEDRHWSAELELAARVGAWNLSPFVGSDGTLYLADNPLNSTGQAGGALLRSTRRVKVEVATLPPGCNGIAWDGTDDLHDHFDLLFDGQVVSVSPTAGTVRVSLIDGARALGRTMMESGADGGDRVYGDPAGTPIEGELQAIIDDNDPARYEARAVQDWGSGARTYINVFSPVSGSRLGEGKPCVADVGDSVRLEGTVNFDITSTVDEADETYVTLADCNGAFGPETVGVAWLTQEHGYRGGRPELWVPVESLWSVYEWNAPLSGMVMDHLVELAEAIGWSVVMRFDNVRRQFRLCFCDESEIGGVVGFKSDRTFNVDRMSATDDRVRNLGVTEYADAADRGPTGDKKRKLVAVIDRDSARLWGRSAFRSSTGDESLLDSSAEATRFGEGVLDALSTPDAVGSVLVPFTIHPEPSDVVGLTGEDTDGLMPSVFSGQEYAAGRAVEHSISRGAVTTTIEVARFGFTPGGRTAAKRNVWERALDRSGVSPGVGASAVSTPDAPDLTYLGSVGGVRVCVARFDAPFIGAGVMERNRQWRWTEIHLSTVSNFTPDDTTLLGVASSSTYVITAEPDGDPLAGSTTYYVKVVHADWLRLRSEVSTQSSFAT